MLQKLHTNIVPAVNWWAAFEDIDDPEKVSFDPVVAFICFTWDMQHGDPVNDGFGMVAAGKQLEAAHECTNFVGYVYSDEKLGQGQYDRKDFPLGKSNSSK